MAECAIALLEDRYREKTSLDRERLARFVPLVEQLAQEEPELLAMLVDELYGHQGPRRGIHPEPKAEASLRQEDGPKAKRRHGRRKKS